VRFSVNFKCPIHSLVNWVILRCDIIPDGKLSKLHSFDRQYRMPQYCHFQSSFTERTAQITEGIPHTFCSVFHAVFLTQLNCRV
jgi:hypothetical protein